MANQSRSKHVDTYYSSPHNTAGNESIFNSQRRSAFEQFILNDNSCRAAHVRVWRARRCTPEISLPVRRFRTQSNHLIVPIAVLILNVFTTVQSWPSESLLCIFQGKKEDFSNEPTSSEALQVASNNDAQFLSSKADHRAVSIRLSLPFLSSAQALNGYKLWLSVSPHLDSSDSAHFRSWFPLRRLLPLRRAQLRCAPVTKWNF